MRAPILIATVLGYSACVVESPRPSPKAGARQEARPAAASPADAAASPERERKPAAEDDVAAALRGAIRPEARQGDSGPSPEPPPAVARRQPGTTLLEAGTEPRRGLRLRPAVGDEQRLTLSLAMTVSMRLGRQAIEDKRAPTMHADVDLRVDEVADDGTATYAIEVADVRVDDDGEASPRVTEAVERVVTSLRTAKGKVRVGPRGVSHDLPLAAADDGGLSPALEGFREAFAALFAPLPDGQVGVGARWEVVTHGEQAGLPIQRVAEYRLAGADPDGLDVSVTVSEHAMTGAGGDPMEGGEAAPRPARATAFAATGKGTTQLRLDRVAPTEGRATIDSTTHVELTLAGAPQTVVMGLHVVADLRAR